MQFIRFLSLLMCAEWLLIFRIWPAFRWLVLFVAFSFFRARFLDFIPHWDSSYIIFPVAAVAMLYHLRCIWNRRSARNREIYNMPDTGVSWLVLIAQTPKAAQFLESLIMMAFLVYMVRYGNLVYPPGFGALPPAWKAWLSRPGHAELFSVVYALGAMVGLSFWNVIASGAPLWKPKAAPSIEAYPTVREARRTPPRLPSVKELADEHRQLYG
jgi:hypothetical protein